MRLLKSIILATALCCSSICIADSPITSTDFHNAYADIAMVGKAKTTRILTDEIADFLLSEENKVDEKMAVINALGWEMNGKKNAQLFKQLLEKKYNQTEINLEPMSAEDLCCYGYLTIMDNYFVYDDALNILKVAQTKNKNSFTIAIIVALVEAQKAMDSNWCRVWKVCEAVDKNKKYKKDMRDEAIKVIFDYVVLYKESC